MFWSVLQWKASEQEMVLVIYGRSALRVLDSVDADMV